MRAAEGVVGVFAAGAHDGGDHLIGEAVHFHGEVQPGRQRVVLVLPSDALGVQQVVDGRDHGA